MSEQPNKPKKLYLERSEAGFPRGSIGDLSMRLGQDVRDLLRGGTTLAEIHQMIAEREATSEKK